jgi:hypothetical protein
MAYYRKKYDKPETPEKGGNRNQNSGQRPGRDSEDRKPAKHGGGRGRNSGGVERKNTSPSSGAKAEKSAPVRPAGTKQGGQKKGILTKLLGIFKKGK